MVADRQVINGNQHTEERDSVNGGVGAVARGARARHRADEPRLDTSHPAIAMMPASRLTPENRLAKPPAVSM